MKQSRNKKTENLRFLTIRAVVVIVVVVAALLALRIHGITVRERDVPVPVVEEITREDAGPADFVSEIP